MHLHLDLSREEHLNKLHRMLSYLNKCHNTELAFDPSDSTMRSSKFKRIDMTPSEFSHVMKKGLELPASVPQPRSVGFSIRTRRSRTRFIVCSNSSRIYCNSKEQNSTESSSFGSEFAAMK